MKMDITALDAVRREQVRGILRKEFKDFFRTMTTGTESWPKITDQELVNALADSLLDMGRDRGMGIALLQTLVLEMQDRINDTLN